ncbi:hypothetical protein CBR_g66786 [Chara braunii]|uniref:Uncharacterized protein n=1 Tax=Chara braunii TaxID=69332 RepID=A0A388K9C6_CHABU|nr:hypothetical protein CBR_g66786 [Chara braunii]|eukprot:GBG66650.1 hypothetical protein CBR_g66786 [Chara braunii]
MEDDCIARQSQVEDHCRPSGFGCAGTAEAHEEEEEELRWEILCSLRQMEKSTVVIEQLRRLGGGRIARQAQTYFFRCCVDDPVSNRYPPPAKYLQNLLKRVILAAERDGIVVLDELYDIHSKLLVSSSQKREQQRWRRQAQPQQSFWLWRQEPEAAAAAQKHSLLEDQDDEGWCFKTYAYVMTPQPLALLASRRQYPSRDGQAFTNERSFTRNRGRDEVRDRDRRQLQEEIRKQVQKQERVHDETRRQVRDQEMRGDEGRKHGPDRDWEQGRSGEQGREEVWTRAGAGGQAEEGEDWSCRRVGRGGGYQDRDRDASGRPVRDADETRHRDRDPDEARREEGRDGDGHGMDIHGPRGGSREGERDTHEWEEVHTRGRRMMTMQSLDELIEGHVEGGEKVREEKKRKEEREEKSVVPVDLVTVRVSENLLEGSTGCVAWGAGFYLAEVVLTYPAVFAGRTCLELGSGTGLVGVCLARLQGSNRPLYLTDGNDEALCNLSINLAINGIAVGGGGGGGGGKEEGGRGKEEGGGGKEGGRGRGGEAPLATRYVSNLSIDGDSMSSAVQGEGIGIRPSDHRRQSRQHRTVIVDKLCWEDAAQEPRKLESYGADVILGADIVYDPSVVPTLVEVLGILLRCKGRVCIDQRGDEIGVGVGTSVWGDNASNSSSSSSSRHERNVDMENEDENDEIGRGGNSNGGVAKGQRNDDVATKQRSDDVSTVQRNDDVTKDQRKDDVASDWGGDQNGREAKNVECNKDDDVNGCWRHPTTRPVAYVASTERNEQTMLCFLDAVAGSGLAVMDVTTRLAPDLCFKWVSDIDRSRVRLHRIFAA